MNKKHLYLSIFILILSIGCRDEFGEINTPSDKVTDPDPIRLFTKALTMMDNDAYLEWFYNNSMYLKWSQATVTEGGNQVDLNVVKDFYAPQQRLLAPKLQIEEIRYLLREKYSESEAAPYRYLQAICNPVLVYLGLFGTDFYGSMAYTEASTAPYTSPPIITPKYQTQEELLEIWLNELNETIATLTNPIIIDGQEISQISPQAQDLFYNGDWTRWTKFANSLKLKIAVRMLGFDRARALKIAEEVVANPVGIMSTLDDDLIYRQGSEYYRFGDAIENAGIGSEILIDFLRTNQDPRLRFLFAKNDFNASVVQAFFDAERDVPSYILDMAEYAETFGRKTFIDWKILGEPWVRYHGAPVDIQAPRDAAVNNAYFNTENFKLPSGNGTKTYQPLSLYNEEMVRGSTIYTYPSAPNVTAVQDNVSRTWHGALYSAAETNLYLAEFALLGASLPENAAAYYQRGIELSVRLFDKIAGLNKIPYYEYHIGFDTTDETIALNENEITPLINRYVLTGTVNQQLEQIYLQQYIHHLYLPQELLVTVRRSGYPARESGWLGRAQFNSTDASYPVPRRLPTPALDPSDGMHDIKKAAYEAEGFTPGTNAPSLLQSERVDYDKNAPSYGSGAHSNN